MLSFGLTGVPLIGVVGVSCRLKCLGVDVPLKQDIVQTFSGDSDLTVIAFRRGVKLEVQYGVGDCRARTTIGAELDLGLNVLVQLSATDFGGRLGWIDRKELEAFAIEEEGVDSRGDTVLLYVDAYGIWTFA